MLSLIIIILIFYIFFKKYNKKKYENFDDLNTAIENCGSPCKCKYGTDGNESDCKLCFPDTIGTDSGMSFDPICANPDRLRKCYCGVKGLCSPCQEDMDAAYIYALQKMCTNRGYVWKYSQGLNTGSGNIEEKRGYVWDCLHTEATCRKESLRELIHMDNDPNYETADKYFEWDDVSKKCFYASPYLRNMCEGQNQFWYHCRGSVRGKDKCHFSEKYCNSYAQDGFRKKECYVPTGQLIAENIAGETGVRAARVNYECPTHHEDDGLAFGKVTIRTDDNGACKLNRMPWREKADVNFSRWAKPKL